MVMHADCRLFLINIICLRVIHDIQIQQNPEFLLKRERERKMSIMVVKT